ERRAGVREGARRPRPRGAGASARELTETLDPDADMRGEMTALERDHERRVRFNVLYEANYERILGYALRRTQHADALDVVSETFTVAWRRLAQLPEGDEARLWLYGTARRVLANHQRSLRRRARLGGRLHDEASSAPSASSAEPTGAVAAAFARL